MLIAVLAAPVMFGTVFAIYGRRHRRWERRYRHPLPNKPAAKMERRSREALILPQEYSSASGTGALPRAGTIADYRLVRMDIGGDRGRTVTAEHSCDDDAIAQAKVFAAGRAVEIWCGDRQLAMLLPN